MALILRLIAAQFTALPNLGKCGLVFLKVSHSPRVSSSDRSLLIVEMIEKLISASKRKLGSRGPCFCDALGGEVSNVAWPQSRTECRMVLGVS
jgi:hypothetical protein